MEAFARTHQTNHTNRDTTRTNNPYDPTLKGLNLEINFPHTTTQNKHMEGIPMQNMGSQTKHAHTVDNYTWAR